MGTNLSHLENMTIESQRMKTWLVLSSQTLPMPLLPTIKQMANPRCLRHFATECAARCITNEITYLEKVSTSGSEVSLMATFKPHCFLMMAQMSLNAWWGKVIINGSVSLDALAILDAEGNNAS